MPEIKAITFDVGGTLIQPWPSVGHIYATVAEEQGIPGLSAEELNQRFASAWKSLGCRAECREDWAAIVRATFSGIPTGVDLESLFQALYTRFTEPSAWHVFDDVVPALESLQDWGIRLAIVSNWDDRLRPLLDQLNLAGYFECIVVSCEAGVRKPQPAIFQNAIDQLKLAPARVLHVGDSREHDWAGARNAGLSAIGIRRHGVSSEPFWIHSLQELLEPSNPTPNIRISPGESE